MSKLSTGEGLCVGRHPKCIRCSPRLRNYSAAGRNKGTDRHGSGLSNGTGITLRYTILFTRLLASE